MTTGLLHNRTLNQSANKGLSGEAKVGSREPKELTEQLNDLRHQGANHYDPPRFYFIESLIRRAKAQRESARLLLEPKAQLALDNYKSSVETARLAAEASLGILLEAQSGSILSNELASKLYTEANNHFKQGQFNQVAQLAKQWRRLSKCNTGPSAGLAELTQQLAKPLAQTINTNQSTSALNTANFTEQLQLQEKAIQEKYGYASIHNNKSGLIENIQGLIKPQATIALKSSINLQQHQQKQRTDQFIDIAFNEKPETPGPLNPENLAIGLLKAISNLSPEYLRRYVGYFESLQCLEKVKT